jgi:hypothetical protein
MSDTQPPADRDKASGRFLAGNSGNGGRKPGSRNKLGEAFVADLRDCWEKHGVAALERCAVEEPATLIKVVAGLLPKDFNLNVGVDAASFANTFRGAIAMLGNSEQSACADRCQTSV